MADIVHTKKMYGWSKWGGANLGLFIEDMDEWCCQACGGKQPRGLPSYMLPHDSYKRDYFRICSVCKALALVRRIEYMMSLTSLTRIKRHLFTDQLENL